MVLPLIFRPSRPLSSPGNQFPSIETMAGSFQGSKIILAFFVSTANSPNQRCLSAGGGAQVQPRMFFRFDSSKKSGTRYHHKAQLPPFSGLDTWDKFDS